MLVINVAGVAVMLVRHLDTLPFSVSAFLIVGIINLVCQWWRWRWHHERISFLLISRKLELHEKSVETVLDTTADAIEAGLVLTNTVAILFLGALYLVIRTR